MGETEGKDVVVAVWVIVCVCVWNEDLSHLFLKKLLNAILENQYMVTTIHIHQICLFLKSL